MLLLWRGLHGAMQLPLPVAPRTKTSAIMVKFSNSFRCSIEARRFHRPR